MDQNQDTNNTGADGKEPEPKAQDANAPSMAMASAIMAAFADHQRQQALIAMVHGTSSALLENVLKILDDERERLYQTRQTDCPDVRRNNAWLNTLFSGVGPVSYDDLRVIIEHWKDGVAARRQVGGFQ